MCGLVGLYGKSLSIAAEKMFKYALYFDQLRGEDSTGVMIASKDFIGDGVTTEVVKSLGTPSELYKKFGKFQGKTSLTNKANIFCLLGHNRYATQGGISEETAHPFDFGEVVGAHNGTVLKYTLEKLHEAKNYEVDSQRIYSHLGQGNPITDVWEVADGAMALTWFNKTDYKLRIIRNKDRPLYIAYSKDQKMFAWASESWMLSVSADLAKVEIEEPFMLKENLLVEVFFNEEGRIVTTEVEVPPFVRKTYGYSGSFKGYNWDDDDNWMTPKGNNNVTPLKKQPLEFQITELHDLKHGWRCFGKTLPGGTEVTITIPAGVRGTNIVNNIRQRGVNRGHYVASNYSNIMSGGKPSFFVDYTQCVFMKRKPRKITVVGGVPGFGAARLSQEQWGRAVQCGCLHCNEIPEFKDANNIKWVSVDDFICAECVSLPWMEDLITQLLYQSQQQKQA